MCLHILPSSYSSVNFELKPPLGRVNHSWSELQELIDSFFETCNFIQSQNQRKGNHHLEEEIDAVRKNILKIIFDIVENPNFPVSQWYKNKTINWIKRTFEDHQVNGLISSKELTENLKDSKFAFKTNYLLGSTITLLEENENPLGNPDGTTGLVTWQGAHCLYNWVTNASWLINENSKVSFLLTKILSQRCVK